MTEKLSQAEFLDLLIEKAPELRKAGVAHFTLAGEVALHPYYAEPPQLPKQPDADADQSEDQGDPLDDPAAYGLAEGSALPWSSSNE